MIGRSLDHGEVSRLWRFSIVFLILGGGVSTLRHMTPANRTSYEDTRRQQHSETSLGAPHACPHVSSTIVLSFSETNIEQ